MLIHDTDGCPRKRHKNLPFPFALKNFTTLSSRVRKRNLNQMEDILTDAESREIQAAIQTPEGRSKIGQSMLEPFKLGRDYVAIGRQVFAVDHLPAAAPMWYDLDPQFQALVVGPKGGVDVTEIATTRVNLEPLILAVYPKVGVMDVATRRFNILDREQERAQREMAKLEDDKVFAAFGNANINVPDLVNNGVINPIVTNTANSGAGLSPVVAAQAFAEVEQYDIPVTNIVLHANQQQDLRLWTNRNYDPVTQRELLKTGYVGDLWGAQVRQSRRQTPGQVNFLGDPQYLGVISVRIDLSSMDAPDPQNLFYGWVKPRMPMNAICGECLQGLSAAKTFVRKSAQRLNAFLSEKIEDIVLTIRKRMDEINWFFEAIGVAQLIGVASSQANVTGNYYPTYPTS